MDHSTCASSASWCSRTDSLFDVPGMHVPGVDRQPDWANYGDGTINAAPLAGGSSYVLVGGQAQPYGVAVDGTSIYWTTWNWVAGGPAGSGGVYQAPLSGEFAKLLVGGESLPAGLTVDGTSVYWASYGDSAIKRAPLGGGTSIDLIDVSGAPAPRGVALPSFG